MSSGPASGSPTDARERKRSRSASPSLGTRNHDTDSTYDPGSRSATALPRQPRTEAAPRKAHPCCSVCGQAGHNNRKCPVQPRQSSVTCALCRRVGHNRRTCTFPAPVDGRAHRASRTDSSSQVRVRSLLPSVGTLLAVAARVVHLVLRMCMVSYSTGRMQTANWYACLPAEHDQLAIWRLEQDHHVWQSLASVCSQQYSQQWHSQICRLSRAVR